MLSRLQFWIQAAQQDGGKLADRLVNAGSMEQRAVEKRCAAEVKRADRSKAELDRLFAKL